ncbi:hypothetical protein QTG56_24920 (plasmid) [Rossellomorea sp. AcN35-11]|nr:hypothetical protein [Rossellomorea aquimaris]WJV31878.1 hypothetical protein QTG56_24920 [Rossellomorea sp. AcN35-11]
MERKPSVKKVTPQDDDLKIIDEYILLTTLIEILEIDLLSLSKSGLKLQIAYVKMLENVLEICRKELPEIKALMRKKGIKVFDRTRDEDFNTWKYLCRGYEGETKKWVYALRNQTVDKFTSYLENGSI